MTDLRAAYARAGVDVTAGERAVELMRASVASTRRPEVLGGLGGFGSAVAIPAGYHEPVIVSSTDGVGTKTAIAAALGRLDTIGIDLVAMCADDVACAGAEPLAFLDYIAIGRLDPGRVASLVSGIAEGCRRAGAALTGGETAEHPGLIGARRVRPRGVLHRGGGAQPAPGRVRGAGRGCHRGPRVVRPPRERLLAGPGAGRRARSSDGHALHRSRAPDLGDAATAAVGPEATGLTLGDVLLTPTRVYAKDLLGIRADLEAAGHEVRGMAHVTGGGLPGNVPRALPEHLGARLDPATWPMPSIMSVLGALGGIAGPELRATFNGGLGMVVVVPAGAAAATVALARARTIPAWVVGEVVETASIGGRYAEEGSAR